MIEYPTFSAFFNLILAQYIYCYPKGMCYIGL